MSVMSMVMMSNSYVWTVDGDLLMETTMLTGPFTVGSSVACTVLPNDGKGWRQRFCGLK